VNEDRRAWREIFNSKLLKAVSHLHQINFLALPKHLKTLNRIAYITQPTSHPVLCMSIITEYKALVFTDPDGTLT
jgi:hypothetical protein